MEINEKTVGAVTTIELIGQLWEPEDIRALQQRVNNALAGAVKGLIIDLERLTFISSVGLGTLVRVFRQCSDRKLVFCLYKPQGNVRETIEMSEIHRFIPVKETPDELTQAMIKSRP
jgi:anti-anti-sigma factor